MEDDLTTWVPDIHMGDPSELLAPGFSLVQLWQLGSEPAERGSPCVCLFFSVTLFQLSKTILRHRSATQISGGPRSAHSHECSKLG